MSNSNNGDNISFKWYEISSALKRDYTVQQEKENSLLLLLPTKSASGKERTQLVYVECHAAKDGTEWVHICGRVGETALKRLPAMLEKVDEMLTGGVVMENGVIFARHTAQAEFLSAEEAILMVGRIGWLADELEDEFVGGDEN